MCICINCEYVDCCMTYHAVEEQHQQAHLTASPDFEPKEPHINVNIRTHDNGVDMEWDVVGCLSFQPEQGKWAKLRPGELIPT